MKKLLLGVMVIAVLGTLYVWGALEWNYSTGERAGWVQKFSRKGWICKTWEGELAMVSMPGAAQEKFFFTVWDDEVARQINKAMGRRVSLHYEEKVGLPTTCFGDTRHWVTGISVVPEIPLAPGINVPVPPNGVPRGQPPQTMPQPQVQPQPAAPQLPRSGPQPPAQPQTPAEQTRSAPG